MRVMASGIPKSSGALVGAVALYERFQVVVHEVIRYGLVGLVAFGVDVVTFNLLLYAGSAPLEGHPVSAKVISVVLAATVAFAGNRVWTFKHRSGAGVRREYSLFSLCNAIGLGIAVSCLAVSHHVLGFTGPVADNIAANGVGLALATCFRFWSYRRYVFPHVDSGSHVAMR